MNKQIGTKPDSSRKPISSNRLVDESVDFQSANMLHKMKKIKHKKTQKTQKNFKTIPELDILSNVPQKNRNKTPKNKTKTTDAPSKISIQYIKQLITGDTVENFEDNEYEGKDNIKDPAPKKLFIREQIVRSINIIYDKINYVNTFIATVITANEHKTNMSVSNLVNVDIQLTDKNQNDVAIVRNLLVWCESAAISTVMAYQWYFLMYYTKDNDIEVPHLSRLELFKLSKQNVAENPLAGFYATCLYLFEFAFAFPENLDNMALKYYPAITTPYLNGTLKFLILYAICLYVTKNFAITFKNFLIDLITDATSNRLINLMFAYVFIAFFLSIFSFNFIGDMKIDTGTYLETVGNFMNPIGSFLRSFFRFLITMAISVPIGAISCCLYLIFYSFFGFSCYNNVKTDIGTVKTTWADVKMHINQTTAGFDKDDSCYNDKHSWLYTILRIIFLVADFIKDNLSDVVYFFIFLFATVRFSSELSVTMKNRTVLIAIVAGFFSLPAINLIIKFINLYRNKSTESTESTKPAET